jgi:hypothetical protein
VAEGYEHVGEGIPLSFYRETIHLALERKSLILEKYVPFQWQETSWGALTHISLQ